MADKVLENNQVSIVGEIVSDFSYSHEVYGEGFFEYSSSAFKYKFSFLIFHFLLL